MLAAPDYKVNTRSRLCSKHFAGDQFKIIGDVQRKTRNILQPTAVPFQKPLMVYDDCEPTLSETICLGSFNQTPAVEGTFTSVVQGNITF